MPWRRLGGNRGLSPRPKEASGAPAATLISQELPSLERAILQRRLKPTKPVRDKHKFHS